MSEIVDIYKDILDEPDVLSAICKYIAYSRNGFYYDFGKDILPKGTVLYRIRDYKESTDYSEEKEWAPSPFKRQNRCNHDGETALYLGSTEWICLLETNIPYGEKYVLGRYEVNRDIELGGFIYVDPSESNWKQYVGILLNAFLIAPSRNKYNSDVFTILDDKFSDKDFSNIRLKDIFDNPTVLPYRIGAINKRDKYYNITNELCDVLKNHYPKGIRYSSCWIPVETIGIECSAYNVVLYEQGINSLDFISYEVKQNNSKATQAAITEIFSNTGNNNQ